MRHVLMYPDWQIEQRFALVPGCVRADSASAQMDPLLPHPVGITCQPSATPSEANQLKNSLQVLCMFVW